MIENLEPRQMLAVFTVDSPQDNTTGGDGLTTLREAITAAADSDVIEFDSSLSASGPATIQLSSALGPLTIQHNLTIDGPGVGELTIDAQGNSRVFELAGGKTATLRGLTITGGGSVDIGAGIYSYGGDLTLDHVRLTGNSTRRLTTTGNDNGGGINMSYGSLHIIDSSIDNNQARWNAGIAFAADDANDVLEITGSTISNNTALDLGGNGATGGLGVFTWVGDAVLTVTNSTFSGNSAGSIGAIYVGWGAHLAIVNSTITNNEATVGTVGGINVNDTGSLVTLYNSIVAGNIDYMWGGFHRDVAHYLGTFDASSSYNLIGAVGWSEISSATDHHNQMGTDTSPLDPGLAPLGDYGGPTKTHALLVGSPALDAGNDDLAIDFYEAPLESDQRGHLRPLDLPDVDNTGSGSVDIGAFEAGNPTPLVVTTLDDELDDINALNFDFSDLSLREALEIAATRAGGEQIDLTNLYGGIYLELGELDIHSDDAGSVSIIGPSADYLTIDAHGDSRVFHVDGDTTASIKGLTISGGETSGNGGGILAEGNLTLSSSVVTGNQAASGGGIYSGRTVQSGQGIGESPRTYHYPLTLQVLDSTIENNFALSSSASDGFGGGIAADSSLVITGSKIGSNHADNWGGGVYAHWIQMSNSIVSNNTANQYGGIYFRPASSIVNSTVSGNTAEAGIGGLGVPSYADFVGPLQGALVLNTTITHNDSGTGVGGGIYGGSGGFVALVNSIVAENTAGNGATPDDVAGNFNTCGTNNLIGSVGDSYGLNNSSSIWGTDAAYQHAGLISLGDNAGQPDTYTLAPDSPAIDAGNDDAVATYDLVFDQMGEGFDRVLGDHVDIGANEAHVIQSGSTVQVYGTELDDYIHVAENDVTIDRIGTVPVDLASADQINIDTLAGDDHIWFDDSVSIPISVANHSGDINHPPVVQPIETRVVNAGSLLQFRVVAYDIDESNSNLHFSFDGPDYGATLSSTGLFSWTPDWDVQQDTDYSFHVVVADNGTPQLQAEAEFKIHVIPATPTDLKFGYAKNENGLYVYWTAVQGAAGYMVERRAWDGVWTEVGNTTNTYFDDGGPFGTVEYQVKAYNSDGQFTPYSAPVTDNFLEIPSVASESGFHTEGSHTYLVWSAYKEFTFTPDGNLEWIEFPFTDYIVDRWSSTAGWTQIYRAPKDQIPLVQGQYSLDVTDYTTYGFRVRAVLGDIWAVPEYNPYAFSGIDLAAWDGSYTTSFDAAIADSQEESVGYFIPLNNNFDEGNKDQYGNPVPDNQPDYVNGDRIKYNYSFLPATDRQLRELGVDFGINAIAADRFKFDFSSAVKLWMYSTTDHGWVQLASGTTYDDSSFLVGKILVEGVSQSESVRDVNIHVTVWNQASPAIVYEDGISLTVGNLQAILTSNQVDGNEVMSADVPVAPYTTEYDGESATFNLMRNGTVIESKEATIENGAAHTDFDSPRLADMDYTVETVFRGKRGTSVLAFIDLDIDSDNNNGFAFPNGSTWEDTIEDNAYALGKLIMLNHFDASSTVEQMAALPPDTPVEIRLSKNLNPDDPSIRIRINWDPVGPAGRITLSNADAYHSSISDLVNFQRIYDGSVYSLRDLNYDPSTGMIRLFARGTRENPLRKTLAGVETNGKPNETITATLVMNGQDVAHDDVKYVVASKDSFFYQLQTRPEVRAELAARAAYDMADDRPNFGLKAVSPADMQALGIPDDVILLLGNGSGLGNFKAELYQDFIAGQNQYILAFKGTENLTDWITNLKQGVGLPTDYYDTAMLIGRKLSLVPRLQGHLTITGHSLGGGLASAAAVVSGFPTYTFNAAGLDSATLNEQLYPGSTARYNNAAAFIKAYHVDWDILTIFQKNFSLGSFHPAQAIGQPIELRGPYTVTATIADILAGELGALYFEIQSHLNPAVLYGLLVQNGHDAYGY